MAGSGQSNLAELEVRLNILEPDVRNVLRRLRKSFWLEIAYIVVAYGLAVAGIVASASGAISGTATSILTLSTSTGLGATSSVRVPSSVKDVIQEYLSKSGSWNDLLTHLRNAQKHLRDYSPPPPPQDMVDQLGQMIRSAEQRAQTELGITL